MFSAFSTVLLRDLVLAVRNQADVLTTVFFFIIVVSLFPLGVGPQIETLRSIAAGVVWVAALLATMLSLGRMFLYDFLDGTLEQILLAPQPLAIVVLGKVAAHWLVSGVPLVLISPLLGLQFGLSGEAIGLLMLSLLLGTPVLSLVGAIGAALTLGLRAGGVLISLLVLPLFVPVLIFGSGVVEAANTPGGAGANFSILGAGLVLAVVFAPMATAAALRISMD